MGVFFISAVWEWELYFSSLSSLSHTSVGVTTLTTKWWWASWLSTRPSPTPHQRRRRGATHYCVGAPDILSMDCGGRNLVNGQWELKFWLPTWPSLDITSSVHSLSCCSWGWKSRPFLAWVWVDSFCAVVFRQSGYCLNVLLLGCPFPGHLAERAVFSWGFCLCLSLFLGCTFSNIQCRIREARKKTQRTNHCAVPWAPRSAAALLSSLSVQSSHVCFICSVHKCVMPRIFRYTYKEQGKVPLLHLPRSLHSVAECFKSMDYFPV